MLDEQIIDLIIAIYSIISTIIFGTTCIKRKFLSIWFIGCISFSVGAVGFYFRFLNEMFRLLGDIFYLLAIIIFIVATFYEYHYVIRKGEKLQNNSNYLKSLFLVFASFSINFILIVMVVLVFIVLVMLLRIYLKQKSITHISMFLAMIFGLYTIITTFLNNFGIVGTWELSYVGNITLITFLLITALAAPIEDRIQKSEKKYQELYEELEGLINSLPGAFYLFTKEGQYRRWNKELERVSGYSHDEIMMMKPLDFFPSHEKEKVADAIKRGLKEGYEEVEAEVLTKNNQRIPYFFAASYFKTESKDSFVGIGLDITEIKKAEENLRESEEKYHTLFDGANDAIFIMVKEIFVECNKKTLEMFGCENERDLIGVSPWVFSPTKQPDGSDSIEKALEYINNAFSGKPQRFYWKHSKKDGMTFDAEVSLNRILIDDKYMIQAIVRDITEKKIAEQKLKESEEKFRVITEQSFIGALIEQDFDIKYVNPQFSKMIGYSTEELLNWKLTDFYEIFHPDDLDKFKELVEKKTKDLIQDITNFQFRLSKKTGEIIWLELFSKAIMYQDKPSNLAFLLDITEKREAERLIIEENKRLIELDQMRTDLINRISHELKTPLTSIFGVSQILIQKKDDLDIHSISEFINILHSGSVRLNELVENLIDASRLDISKLELTKKKENIVIILENCVREMMHLVNSRDLNIYSDLPDQLYFEVDKLRFEQVVINLLSNAINNTLRGGNIFITLSETGGNIEIKVRDTGVGLTNEEKKMLFKKFGKIERYGQDLDVGIEGVGLGLYISKEIVELHGGKIWVESDGRNKGSTFIVRLFILKKDD